jgi:hypothetical protein
VDFVVRGSDAFHEVAVPAHLAFAAVEFRV